MIKNQTELQKLIFAKKNKVMTSLAIVGMPEWLNEWIRKTSSDNRLSMSALCILILEAAANPEIKENETKRNIYVSVSSGTRQGNEG